MQQFRLLELPPEIVELIDAPNPPLCVPMLFPRGGYINLHRLSIKSQAPSVSSSTPNPSAAYAVLCAPDKTFQLRQVQTSNSLFVTQPAFEAHGSDLAFPTTRAIASCATTLELHPDDSSPAAYLEGRIPVYDLIDGEVDVAGNGKSKAAIFSHMPFSDGQCEQSWRDMMAFEFAGSSYRPSANTLLQVWKSVNAAATAEGVKLESQFLAEDITRPVSEEGHPSSLLLALLQYLTSDDQDRAGPWCCLDRTKTVQFVGKTLLAAKRGDSDYLTAEFVDIWKDSLPESWREDAELKAIDGSYDLPSSTTISLKGQSLTAKGVESAPPKAASSSRKWHEKFGRARQR